MAGGNSITRRISLEGASEIIESLKKLGEAGKGAFEEIQKSAEKVKGPDPSVFDRLKKSLTEIGGSLVEVGKSITSFGVELSKVSAAVTGVIIGLGLIANSAAETADAIEKNAQKVGLGAEAFQKLSFAARQTDVDADSFTTAMGRLSKQLEDARDGSKEAIANFQKMGLSLHDIETLTPDQALEKLADHFAKLPDGVQKSAEAIKIFGRGGIQLIPLLDEGSKGIREFGDEFDRLTLGLTDDQIKISKTFIEQKHELEDVFASLKNQIGLVFVPAMTEAAKAVTEFVANNKVAIVAFVQGIVDGFQSLPGPVKTAIEFFVAFSIAVGPVVIAVGLFVQAIGFAFIGIGSLIGGIGTLITTIGGGLGVAMEFAAGAIGLLLSPIGLTILAIAAFVAAVVFLAVEIVKHWDEISAAWEGFETDFIKRTDEIAKAIRALPAAFVSWLADIVGRASAAATAIVGFFKSIPGRIIDFFKSLVKDFFDLLAQMEDRATSAATGIKDAFVGAFDDIWNKAKSVVTDILNWLGDLIREAARAALSLVGLGGGGPVGNAGGPGFDGGGQVRGPGTSASDSIPARLSNGEFVMRARAVRRHGVGFMQRLNGLQMPRFAMGGLVAPALAFASGGLVGSDAAPTMPVASVHLHIGGKQFPLTGPQQVVDDLMIAVRQSNLASAGKVPGV